MEKINIELIKIFGPSILKVSIPKPIIDNLNNYIDKIILDKKKSKELDIGERLVGDVTQEFELEQKIMQESGWGQFLSNCVSKWIELETKNKITKFQILKSWVVRQYENEYNPTHWHSGHISGAGFLKVPSTFGKHIQKKTTRTQSPRAHQNENQKQQTQSKQTSTKTTNCIQNQNNPTAHASPRSIGRTSPIG